MDGTRYNIFVAAYNTKLVKKDELPKSYDDLLDPSGRASSASKSTTATGSSRDGPAGRGPGPQAVPDIVATNGISVRKGHSLLANLIVSGEVPFAVTLTLTEPRN